MLESNHRECGILSRGKMSHSQTAFTVLCCPLNERFRRCITRPVASWDREQGSSGGRRRGAVEDPDDEEHVTR